MGVATSPEAPKEAEDDMSGQALAVDIALKFIVRRSRTLLSDGSWEIHTDERTGEYIGILREIHKDVTQRHSIADSHAALSESDMTECYRLLEEHAKPMHEGMGHSENQESRQAFRAWMHTTYGGNGPIDITLRLGGITKVASSILTMWRGIASPRSPRIASDTACLLTPARLRTQK